MNNTSRAEGKTLQFCLMPSMSSLLIPNYIRSIPDCPRRWRPIHEGLFENICMVLITVGIEDFRMRTAGERSRKTVNQLQLLKSLFCLAAGLWVALPRYVSILYRAMLTLRVLINIL